MFDLKTFQLLIFFIPVYYLDTDFDLKGCVSYSRKLAKKYTYFTILEPFSAKNYVMYKCTVYLSTKCIPQNIPS